MYCEVYLFDAPYHIDRPFDYFSAEPISVGDVVRVPFGRANSSRLAVVTKVKDTSEGEGIKSIFGPIGLSLDSEMLGLCLFLKGHTLCTFGEAVRCLIPPDALTQGGGVKVKKTCVLLLSKDETDALLSATGRAGIRSDGQRRVIEYLRDIGTADMELIREIPGVSSQQILALRDKGIIKILESESIRNPYAEYARMRDNREIILSDAQKRAYDSIEDELMADEARAALLFGITGSGKTQVIMKTIDKTLSLGKSVIMLVPEIALTPQTVNIFCRRYGERVAVIHSSLSKGERYDAWRRIKRGEVDLVIGTRSAIFAPVQNLGLIVIDEEHEHTYKSESDPKYHAKDVAAYRCGRNKALMLLASATPSLESFYKAKNGVYKLVPLRERYGGASLPQAIIVDMREELRLGNLSPISARLYSSLKEGYERDKQSIIFLNRRGYSTQISCKECGEVLTCPHCSVSLTHHTDSEGGRLLCHMCGYGERLPRKCPSCGAERLSYLGYGTQKLEGEIGKYLPDVRVLRMDADTTTQKMSYDRMLEDFREGRADVLLGTQMVAKGHDFPRVTLVGVALADTSLFVSDFRASERTFSLLTQVIGRAGRAGDEGVAVIQTFVPKNEVIRLACLQDYEKFYEGEIALRRELSYPPFCDIVNLTLTSDNEAELRNKAALLSDTILKKLSGELGKLPFIVFGPFEAAVYKINEKYRMRMVVKCKLNKESRGLFHGLLCEFASHRGVTLSIDFNPMTI
ncbi:MAG: primosomal protein N' [Clostridia bacterium]|nr:primosomal protein N' [Clostridia bacterium]